MNAKEWATRKLRSGDLSALAAIASGSAGYDDDRVDRLRQRGFVAAKDDGRVVVTARGRAALLIKRLTMH